MENLSDEDQKLFDVTEEDMESMKDINERLVVDLNKTYKLKILSEKPKIVDIPLNEAELKQAKAEAKAKGKSEEVPTTREARIIEVENLEDGCIYDLFITPKTLKARIARLYAKHEGSLKDIYVNIGKRSVAHKLYGEIPMYWVREMENVTDVIENQSDIEPPVTE